MKLVLMSALAIFLSAVSAHGQGVIGGTTFDSIRPPATPLIVRQPYVSVWQATDDLNGSVSTFWAGQAKPMAGIVRIDGKPYAFLGNPSGANGPIPLIHQTALQITATQSIYTFVGSGIKLTVDFLSPVEATDIRRQSIPLGYIISSAKSADGDTHSVQVYFDITGDWATGDSKAPINWQRQSTVDATGRAIAFTSASNRQAILTETGDSADWGKAIWATEDLPNVSNQAGAATAVRGDFCVSGALTDSVDTDQPRALSDRLPVFAFAIDLGQVSTVASLPIVIVAGTTRDPSVSYLGTPVHPLWMSYWPYWQDMTTFFLGDAADALKRADKLDSRIQKDAEKAGGAHYAEHDIGSSYPRADGHNDGGGENMPVEESANMLIMTAAYLRYAPMVDAQNYAQQHYRILKQWADYLIAIPPRGESANALDPQNQNQTDDFTGPIAHSVNLALKGILGVGAMGQIAGYAGNADDQSLYAFAANAMIQQWAQLAQSADGSHLLLQYVEPDTPVAETDPEAAWSLKYNAFPDKLLGLNLVPRAITQEEAKFYASKSTSFGVPLDNRHNYTKTDWELWTAASTEDKALRQTLIDGVYNFANNSIARVLRQTLIDGVYNFANNSIARVPFSDWYDAATGQQVGFEARPVIGGIYALLDRTSLRPNE
jgi:hypothetical protein